MTKQMSAMTCHLMLQIRRMQWLVYRADIKEGGWLLAVPSMEGESSYCPTILTTADRRLHCCAAAAIRKVARMSVVTMSTCSNTCSKGDLLLTHAHIAPGTNMQATRWADQLQ